MTAGRVLTTCLAVLACASCTQAPPAALITVDVGVRQQTFVGWEAAVLGTVRDYVDDLPGFPSLFRQAAGDLGINRLQIAVAAGLEHPAGFAAAYISGALSESKMVDDFFYNIVNDNDDPEVANLAGFDFTLLDWQMEHIVVPYREALRAAGERLLTNVSYVDFRPSSFEHHDHPDEYAEFMLVLFQHLQSRYHLVPDAINVMNEPDQTTWTGAAMGRVIVATSDRLKRAGFTPDFIAPSTVNRAMAVRFFDAILTVPGASEHVKELSYHCYADTGLGSLSRIGRRAWEAGVNTAQNECWRSDNTYRTLHRDLTLGRNSSWQQGTFNGREGYYAIDRATGAATLRPKTRLMRQYYKHIRPGAVRVNASTTDARMDPVAFTSSNARTVVVIAAETGGTITVKGLPAGQYRISYSTEAAFDVHLTDTAVADGRTLSASIPEAGVVTIYAK